MERLPVETALTEQVRRFKSIGRTDNQGTPEERPAKEEWEMSGLLIGTLILWLIIAIIVIVVVVYVVNWLYHRSSSEVSFVRTGFLGERVVINGGAFVLPFIHDFTPVIEPVDHRALNLGLGAAHIDDRSDIGGHRHLVNGHALVRIHADIGDFGEMARMAEDRTRGPARGPFGIGLPQPAFSAASLMTAAARPVFSAVSSFGGSQRGSPIASSRNSR